MNLRGGSNRVTGGVVGSGVVVKMNESSELTFESLKKIKIQPQKPNSYGEKQWL